MLPRPALELVVPPPLVPLLTQMLLAFRSLLLPLLSPMPLLDHLQVPGKQAHWHQLGQLDQSIGSTGSDAYSIAPTYDYAFDATEIGSATG